MIFEPTPIAGAFLIALEKRGDERGFFARMFCEEEFARAGLESQFKQMNDSYSTKRGTLRGMHYQLPPRAEVKLVRCVRGAVFDVVLDLRPNSPSSGQYFGAELSAENRLAMYVPRGCAHGYLTLTPESEVIYLVSEFYAPEMERGVRFDDPQFAISWPFAPLDLSRKDANWRDFDADYHGIARFGDLK